MRIPLKWRLAFALVSALLALRRLETAISWRLLLIVSAALLAAFVVGMNQAHGQVVAGTPRPASPVVSPVSSPVVSPVPNQAAAPPPISAQDAGGRDLSRFDWLEHLPIALAAVLLVVVVDGIVITRVLQARRR